MGNFLVLLNTHGVNGVLGGIREAGGSFDFAPGVSLEATPKISSKLFLILRNLVLLTKYRLMIVKRD